MRILVTNDDGIQAPGLQVLIALAKQLSDDVWVVAPEFEQSGASHSLSLRKPLHIRSITERVYAVDGTPTDCVLLAIKEIMKQCRPDWVFSGINRGSNLGEDVTYSGTIAAAMEGTLLGISSLALSQTTHPEQPVAWSVAEKHALPLLRHLTQMEMPAHTLLNINFPHVGVTEVKGVKVAPQGKRKIGDNLHKQWDPEGHPYYWIGSMRNVEKDPPHSDFAAVKEGYISVTPIHLDLTHYGVLEGLDEELTQRFKDKPNGK